MTKCAMGAYFLSQGGCPIAALRHRKRDAPLEAKSILRPLVQPPLEVDLRSFPASDLHNRMSTTDDHCFLSNTESSLSGGERFIRPAGPDMAGLIEITLPCILYFGGPTGE